MLPDSLNINITAVLPEILLTGLAISVLIFDFFLPKEKKQILGYIGIIGLFALLPVVWTTQNAVPAFGETVISDTLSSFFDTIFIIAGILTLIISIDYSKKGTIHKGEYYFITLIAILGMMVMASSNDLLTLYVGLELMTISFYVLVAYRRNETRSVEGALKYFVLGGLSSGIILYGITFAYGVGGTTNLQGISNQVAHIDVHDPFLLLAIVFITVGLSFKIALFPFHLWAPDAYQGAPPPITALLSVGSKAAAFSILFRIFIIAFHGLHPQWSKLLWPLSAATMVFGSVVAISQKNIIRMMAYSSIAHAGMIMIGFLVNSRAGMAGVLYYLLVYTFMNMGVFAVVTLLAKDNGRGENIEDYQGLASRQPLLAFFLALFLLALIGVPPTGGFTAKFFIFAAAIEAGYYGIAIIGVVATAVALFFYTRIIFYMYMKEPQGSDDTVKPGNATWIVLFIAGTGIAILGLYPSPFMRFLEKTIQIYF